MPETPPVRHSGHEPGLERTSVVRAALQLLNDVGYSGLTVRRLAERLGVQAAALYWHFKNKQDLIDAMAHEMLSQAYQSKPPEKLAWQELLTHIARTNRQALISWRDGAQIMAHADLSHSSMLRGMELLLKHLQAQHFSPELAMSSLFTVIRFTLGCVFEEQADPRSHAALDAERLERLTSYPTAAATIAALAKQKALTPERQFEAGLKLILSGIAVQLDATA